MTQKKIRAIAYREQDFWVAQCLEYDIRAQASSIKQLLENLNTVLSETLKDSLERHRKPFAYVNPAPKEFFQMWDDRAGSVVLRKSSIKAPSAPEFPKLSLALAQ